MYNPSFNLVSIQKTNSDQLEFHYETVIDDPSGNTIFNNILKGTRNRFGVFIASESEILINKLPDQLRRLVITSFKQTIRDYRS
jgi:hypothetical protein